MARGIQYNVTTRYRVQTQRGQANVTRMTARVKEMERQMERAKHASRGVSLSLRSIAGPAVLAGLGMVARAFVTIQKRAEDTRIGIAAVFSTLNPKAGFTRSLEHANDLYDRFRKAAITSPATSRQFMQVFQPASAMMSQLGLSNAQMTKGIGRLVPAAMAFGDQDFEQTGRDVREILSGTAGAQTKIFNPIRQRMLKLTGAKDVKSFNKRTLADPKRTWDALQKVLSGMDAVNTAYSTSFSGLTSSTVEMVTMFTEKAGEPLFKALKKELGGLVDWLTKNQDMVNDLADRVGGYLTRAFKAAAAGAKLLVDNMQALLILTTALMAKRAGGAFLGTALGGRVAGAAGAVGAGAMGMGRRGLAAGGRAVGAGLGFAGDMLFANVLGSAPGKARAGGRLASAGRLALAQSGGSLMGAGFNLAGQGKRKAMGAIGSRITGARAAFGSAVVRGGGLAGAAAPLAFAGGAKALTMFKAIGIVLAKAAAASGLFLVVGGLLVGTFIALKNKANEATIFFNTSVRELFITLDKLAMQFGSGGGFADGAKKFAEWLGTGVVGTIGLAVKAIEMFVNAFSYMVAVIKGAAYGLGTVSDIVANQGVLGLARKGAVSGAFSAGMKKAFAERSKAEIAAYNLRIKKEKDAKKFKDAAETPKKGRTKVEVNINQVITTDADPDRIAFRVGEVVRDTFDRFPTTTAGIAGVSGG